MSLPAVQLCPMIRVSLNKGRHRKRPLWTSRVGKQFASYLTSSTHFHGNKLKSKTWFGSISRGSQVSKCRIVEADFPCWTKAANVPEAWRTFKSRKLLLSQIFWIIKTLRTHKSGKIPLYILIIVKLTTDERASLPTLDSTPNIQMHINFSDWNVLHSTIHLNTKKKEAFCCKSHLNAVLINCSFQEFH